MSKKNGHLTPEEFVLLALKKLPDKTKGYTGFHTVFSGFNAAFHDTFPGVDPIEVTKQMELDGKIVIAPVKRGVMIYPAGTAKYSNSGDKALQKMELPS